MLTAGTGGEESVAVDGASLFTSAFLEAARDVADLPIADRPPDGIISLKEMDLHIGRRLDEKIAELNRRRLTDPFKMSPQMSFLGDRTGEFFFISRTYKAKQQGIRGDYEMSYGVPETKGPGRARPSARPAGDLYGGRDTTVFEVIKDSALPEDFENFLAAFPNSVFAPYARNRLARLQQTPSVEDQPQESDPASIEAELDLRRVDRQVVQQALTALGFDTRGVDGIFGANSRRAIGKWQRDRGHAATGYLTPLQYGALLAEAEPKLAALEAAALKDQRQ